MHVFAIILVVLVVVGMRGGVMELALACGCLVTGIFFGVLLASWLGACFGWGFFFFCVLLAILRIYAGCTEG